MDSNFDLEPILRSLASQVEPTATQTQAASRSHNYLRDLLDESRFGARIIDSYLSGSYSRDTAIYPIDDVDIVFLVNKNAWPEGDALLSDLPNPDDVLRSFANTIRRLYDRSSVYTQRRSLRLELHHLHIDVVPAIQDDGDVILIPDARENEWIRSAPAIHRKVGATINSRMSGSFKPTVKLLKYWNSNLPRTARMKSFAVESLAMAIFREHRGKGIFNNLLSYFDFVSQFGSYLGSKTVIQWRHDFGVNLGPFDYVIPDPSGVARNVCKGVSQAVADKFVVGARKARDTLVQAAQSRGESTAGRLLNKALKFD